MDTQTEVKTFKARFVIPRHEKHTLYAIVDIEVSDESLCNETNFLAELRRAVTEWVQTTEEGRALWDNSCNDLNIGDLMNYGCSDDIAALMPSVLSMGLDQIGAIRGGDWTYDTVLVNRFDFLRKILDEVEEIEDEGEGEGIETSPT